MNTNKFDAIKQILVDLPVRKELEGEKKKSGKETEKGKGPGWKWEKEKGRWRKEYGGRRGGERENGLKCPHYPIDYEPWGGGGGGGGGWIWSFVDTFWFLSLHWNFVRTPTKDIIVPTKYLWFTNRIWRRIACFRPKTTKLSARLAQLINASSSFFFFSSFRLVGVVITKQINQNTDILYRQNMLFYQQDIIDWLRRIICFDARVPKFRSARSQSFMGFLEFLVFWSE